MELLLGQGDQRRGVVGDRAGVQGLEQGGLGDQRLAGAGRGADEHALLGREPGEQGLFLHRVGRVGQLGQVLLGQLVAGCTRSGHGFPYWRVRNRKRKPRLAVSQSLLKCL